MFALLFLTSLFAAFAAAQEDGALTPSDKSECIKQFIQWCDERRFPQGNSMNVIALSYRNGDSYYRVFCSTDSEGTNCTRNGSPWFECKPEADGHTLSYKGQVLSEAEADVDDGICNTVNKVTKEMFIQDNFAFDNETMTRMQQEITSFFQEIAAMQAEIYELQKRLTGGSFMDGFLRGFGGDFFGRRPEISAEDENDSSDQSDSKESNQIERE